MKNRLEIKKIHVKTFIETLMEIYNDGVEYFNMVVEKGENQDSLWVVEDVEEENVNRKEVDFDELI